MQDYKNEKIKSMIYKKRITLNEINYIFSISYNEFLNNYEKIKEKDELRRIYLNPTILYDIDILDEKTTKNLMQFVIYKYKNEISEFNYRYLNGEISYDEYKKEIDKIDNDLFPESSLTGKNIKRIMKSEDEKTKVKQKLYY